MSRLGRLTQSWQSLDFHDGGLQVVCDGDAFGEESLRVDTEQRYQVTHAVSAVSRRGNQRNVLLRVRVL